MQSGNEDLQRTRPRSGDGIAYDGGRFENVQASGNSRQHNGNNNIVNNYNAAARYGSIPPKPPDDPVHSDFMRACREGQRPQRLNVLLGRGANIDHRDEQQRTPLHFAASSGSILTVSHLLEIGADVQANGERVGSPLHHAASRGSVEVARCLLDAGADVNASDEWTGTPLHHAAFSGSVDTVRCLLENGGDMDTFEEWIGTPLSIAAARGHLAVIKVLLEYKVDVNQDCRYFGSAACMASAEGSLDVLKMLHQAGADFRVRRQTCLAIYRDVLEPVYWSLPSTLGTRDIERTRVLFSAPGVLAFDHGNLHAAKFCLGLDLGLFVHNKFGRTWYTKDEDWRDPSSIPEFSTNLAVAGLDIDMLRLLLDSGLKLARNEEDGTFWEENPIFYLGTSTTRKGPLDGKNASSCISLLLENGISTDCLDAGRNTPLMAAVRHDDGNVSYDIAKAFLDHGAPVNAVDYHGQTALMIVAGTGNKSRVRCVELLCEYGAAVDLRDNSGRTALRHAEKWGGREDFAEVKRILQHFGEMERNRSL